MNGVKISAKYANPQIMKPIRICKYESKADMEIFKMQKEGNSNLLVKNIAKEIGAQFVWSTFRKYGDIRSCKLVTDFNGNSKGYGFVNFAEEKDAEQALNDLNQKDFEGKPWVIDVLIRGKNTERKKNNIFVKNLPLNFTKEDLEEAFGRFGEIKSTFIHTEEAKGTIAFVCFSNPSEAEFAIKETHGKDYLKTGNLLHVCYAMKKEERKEELAKEFIKKKQLTRNLTIYAKLNEGVSFTEDQIRSQILFDLRSIFAADYNPLAIICKSDRKAAFITMSSKKDADGFVNTIIEKQDLQKFFTYTLYKSKGDRINNNIKRVMNQPQYKTYNNFNQIEMNKQLVQNQNMGGYPGNMAMGGINNKFQGGFGQQAPQMYNNFANMGQGQQMKNMNYMQTEEEQKEETANLIYEKLQGFGLKEFIVKVGK